MAVVLTENAFNPWTQLQIYHAHLFEKHGECGAVANFIGTMRDINENQSVQAMFLEHYAGMTEKYLDNLVAKAKQQWALLDTLVVHRVGHIVPRETIVLVAAWAQHRNDAFAACRYLLEELKFNAPFWKKETLSNGEQRWVTQNTPSE